MVLKIVYWAAVAVFVGFYGTIAATAMNGTPRLFAICLILVYLGLTSVFFVESASNLRRCVILAIVAIPVLPMVWNVLTRR